ncbi:hypothetical protein [Nocardia mexicana]|uniref:Uncharacterized protein n=1 Tax=Nocardia mexicana TaxID=279262 RepID=A0A370GHV7_9NOCA|nr:hypothetical protein [Nocardia mexicana]RDI42940.1 hypothetical protein DFR68_12374 [Nocardia mexicana]
MQGAEDWMPDDVAAMMRRVRADAESLLSGEAPSPMETDLAVLVRSLAHDFAAKTRLAGGWLMLHDSAVSRGRSASTSNGTVLDAAVLDVADLLTAVRVALGDTIDEAQIRVMLLWSNADGTYQFHYCTVSMHDEHAADLMHPGDSKTAWVARAAHHGVDIHTIEGSLFD